MFQTCVNYISSTTDESGRRRRSVDLPSTGCHVTQLEGRDYTEPAFNIEFGVADDRSEVELSYCVGTFSGGCDVIDHEPLGGGSTIVARVGGRKDDLNLTCNTYVIDSIHAQICGLESEG